jgi:pimeloyl-ACP methyl ester carboxylesterase
MAASADEKNAKPKIVLVHGVWSDGSAWAEVIKHLGHGGYQVYAAQIPLTSFEEDVAATKRTIEHAGGPVVLVGHSYGGAVITAAGNSEHVTKLVYIAAFAPEAGQPFGSLLGENPPAAQVEIKPDKDGFVWADAPMFQDAVAHDVHRGLVNLAVAVQKPYAAKEFEATVSDPAWKAKPGWYLVTTEDRILNPKTQHAMAKRINATVREVATSHLPLIANPQAVVDIILEAAAS